VDDLNPVAERNALASLVRQHEARLTRLEVRHDEMEKAVERRFTEIAGALKELRGDVRALTWRTAGSAAGGGGFIAIVIWLFERG
jgi:hypothetical protein